MIVVDIFFDYILIVSCWPSVGVRSGNPIVYHTGGQLTAPSSQGADYFLIEYQIIFFFPETSFEYIVEHQPIGKELFKQFCEKQLEYRNSARFLESVVSVDPISFIFEEISSNNFWGIFPNWDRARVTPFPCKYFFFVCCAYSCFHWYFYFFPNIRMFPFLSIDAVTVFLVEILMNPCKDRCLLWM